MPLTQSRSTEVLLAIAALFIILAGINLGSDLLSPMLLAFFLTMILNPVVALLERTGLPRGIGILLVITLLGLVGAALLGIVGHAFQGFTRALPGYRQDLMDMVMRFQDSLNKRHIMVDFSTLIDLTDTRWLLNFATGLLSRMSSLTSSIFVITLAVVFMLFEVPLLPEKLQKALPHPDRQMKDVERFVKSVNRYVVLKTVLSAITGSLVFLMLELKGVEFSILVGLLAFLLNYIPNFGSIMAAIPGILITLLQKGPADAAMIAGGYVVINMAIGNFIEPKVLGRGLGLSSLVVFMSLLIWGWLLGPIGMLFAVPLTMCIKIFLESSSHHGLAFFLGSGEETASESSQASE